MGCDIHLYFEKKNKHGEWEELEVDPRLIPDDRNYRLFGFLAGVRNDEIPPQFERRGIPEDTSLPKGENGYGLGDHDFTHAYLDEILDAPWKEYELEWSDFYIFCFNTLPKLLYGIGFSKLDERNVRVLIGFDS